MAATQCERVPSLRGYRDALSAENRQMYDEKLKLTAGIDPYAVSDNFYSQSMDEWPEIEFPDILNCFDKFVKCLLNYLCCVFPR